MIPKTPAAPALTGVAPDERSTRPAAASTPLPPPPPPAARPSASTIALSWTALRRGRRPVLAAAQVMLPAGAVVGLVGANGAGKSTLLMALAGTLARRCGQAAAMLGESPVTTVGYVPQRPTLAPWLSVRDALALQGVDATTTLAAMPAADFLTPLLGRRADALSGGQLQLVAVAGVLARSDPLVLLDEPFAGVDLRHRSALVACVAEHRRRSPASVIVVASHLAVDLDALCDWLLVLNAGAMAFVGPRAALPAPPGADATPGEPSPDTVALLERRLAALLG